MLMVSMIFVIFHFILAGMLLGAILTNRAEERSSSWKLYVSAVLCFLFGLYFLIASIGYRAQ